MDLRKQPDALQRIKEEAEKAKIALSQLRRLTTSICRFITAGRDRRQAGIKNFDPREDGQLPPTNFSSATITR